MVMAYAQEDANNDMQVSEHKHKGYAQIKINLSLLLVKTLV